jgi:hypothetical protein
MKDYTAELKKKKVKHEGPHDKLEQMFVPDHRPSIKAMVDFAGSMDGAMLETGVIFGDVSKRFFINKLMSRIGNNCWWIVSTEGDCLFAFKKMERCGSRYTIQCKLQTQTQPVGVLKHFYQKQ